jgi:hypothetical protein
MILYIENLTSTHAQACAEALSLSFSLSLSLNKYSRFLRHKINQQEPVAFLYTNDELAKKRNLPSNPIHDIYRNKRKIPRNKFNKRIKNISAIKIIKRINH